MLLEIDTFSGFTSDSMFRYRKDLPIFIDYIRMRFYGMSDEVYAMGEEAEVQLAFMPLHLIPRGVVMVGSHGWTP